MSVWRLLLREISYRKLNCLLGLLAVVVAAGFVVGAPLLLDQYEARTSEIMATEREKSKRIKEREHKETVRILEKARADTIAIVSAEKAKAEQLYAELQDDIRKTTKGLGFTLTILHKDVDMLRFQSERVTDKYLPEDHVQLLANSEIMTINHLLPILQEKADWEELDGTTITVIGTRGEVGFKDREKKKEMLEMVAEGKIALGYELYRSLLRARRPVPVPIGEKLKLKGVTFELAKVEKKQGNQNDTYAYLNLKDAQELFGKKYLITGIFAVGCKCEADRLATIRDDVAKLLKDAQVVEDLPKGKTRAESRLVVAANAKKALEQLKLARIRHEARLQEERELHEANVKTTREAEEEQVKSERASLYQSHKTLAWILVPLVVVGCGVWLAMVVFTNVQQRRSEIGILRAVGLGSQNLFVLFLSKALLLGLLGAAVGTVMGWSIVAAFGPGTLSHNLGELFEPWIFGLTIGGTIVLCCAAAWLPSMMAARQDPALVLSEE